MNQQGTSLSQIAKRYGISTQTLRRRIEQHPELGIKLVARKRTLLDANQTAALCAILDKLYRFDDGKEAPGNHTGDNRASRSSAKTPAEKRAQSTVSAGTHAGAPTDLDAALARIAELEKKNAELVTETQRLHTDIAVANARAEERGTYIATLERRADAYPRLLKEGKDEARAAGLVEGKTQGMETGREAGIAEERSRWEQMGRWKRFFAKKH
ncbi:MAG: helix-turn-helix domain-containing protein [Eggerthellaceae bacterium]